MRNLCGVQPLGHANALIREAMLQARRPAEGFPIDGTATVFSALPEATVGRPIAVCRRGGAVCMYHAASHRVDSCDATHTWDESCTIGYFDWLPHKARSKSTTRSRRSQAGSGASRVSGPVRGSLCVVLLLLAIVPCMNALLFLMSAPIRQRGQTSQRRRTARFMDFSESPRPRPRPAPYIHHHTDSQKSADLSRASSV